jgi:VCBS repeat-containing protein
MKKFTIVVFFIFLLSFSGLILGGCRSAFVSTTIANHSGKPVSLLEVDYPSASFGVGTLATGGEYHYRFKIQGSGSIKLQFTDSSGKTHTVSGPDITEGEQGTLQINIGPADEISWVPNLTKIR